MKKNNIIKSKLNILTGNDTFKSVGLNDHNVQKAAYIVDNDYNTKAAVLIENNDIYVYNFESGTVHSKNLYCSRWALNNKVESSYIRIFGKPLYKLMLYVYDPIQFTNKVAEYKNKNNKLCINHMDLNKLNNRISNLEYCSTIENVKHSVIVHDLMRDCLAGFHWERGLSGKKFDRYAVLNNALSAKNTEKLNIKDYKNANIIKEYYLENKTNIKHEELDTFNLYKILSPKYDEHNNEINNDFKPYEMLYNTWSKMLYDHPNNIGIIKINNAGCELLNKLA